MSRWDSYDKRCDFSDLEGKTLKQVIVDDEEVRLIVEDYDCMYIMNHTQDCCESVYVQDVCGDVNDIIGSPVLVAEESSSCGPTYEEKADKEYYGESYTWTFYKIDTAKGGITIRWLGESNGYYSESVDVYRISARDEVVDLLKGKNVH